MTIEFIVEGVRGKARPRFSKLTGRAYTTKDDKIFEEKVRNAYKGNLSFIDSILPLRAEIEVYHQVPKSYSKKKREQCLTGKLKPQVKPDCDNIAKLILDSNNKVIYKDDSQITELLVKKYYTEGESYMKVKIEEIIGDE